LSFVLLTCALPVGAQGFSKVLHEERSLYRNILVYQEGDTRCLKFGRRDGARQTCRLQNDPAHLIFPYTRMMMAALYLNPTPQRILIIGLGGGTLPGALRTMVPTAQIDVAEIDPAVTRVAYKYFGFTPGKLTAVYEQDGRVFVKRRLREKATYDLIMLDAFTDQYIPEHLLTQEFLQEVKGILNPNGGVLAANTFSDSGLYNHESATYASVFGPFFGLKTNSRVILTRMGSMPSRDELQKSADAIEDKLRPMGTSQDWLLPKFVIEPVPRGTRVLTDQYSPANLLNLK
jgi:spermidine synthase